jgi:hypothetical protein
MHLIETRVERNARALNISYRRAEALSVFGKHLSNPLLRKELVLCNFNDLSNPITVMGCSSSRSSFASETQTDPRGRAEQEDHELMETLEGLDWASVKNHLLTGADIITIGDSVSESPSASESLTYPQGSCGRALLIPLSGAGKPNVGLELRTLGKRYVLEMSVTCKVIWKIKLPPSIADPEPFCHLIYKLIARYEYQNAAATPQALTSKRDQYSLASGEVKWISLRDFVLSDESGM